MLKHVIQPYSTASLLSHIHRSSGDRAWQSVYKIKLLLNILSLDLYFPYTRAASRRVTNRGKGAGREHLRTGIKMIQHSDFAICTFKYQMSHYSNPLNLKDYTFDFFLSCFAPLINSVLLSCWKGQTLLPVFSLLTSSAWKHTDLSYGFSQEITVRWKQLFYWKLGKSCLCQTWNCLHRLKF